MPDLSLACSNGHPFGVSKPFSAYFPDKEVIAMISWCPQESCGGKIVWMRGKELEEVTNESNTVN